MMDAVAAVSRRSVYNLAVVAATKGAALLWCDAVKKINWKLCHHHVFLHAICESKR